MGTKELPAGLKKAGGRRDSKVRSLQPATGLGSLPLALIQKNCSHARASAYARGPATKLCRRRNDFLPPHRLQVGFRSAIQDMRATTIWSHAENFFRPFDFGRYSPMTYRGKSNAYAGW